MEQLTINELACYLPYELKFTDQSTLYSISIDGELMLLDSKGGISNYLISWEQIKPILFPMEMIEEYFKPLFESGDKEVLRFMDSDYLENFGGLYLEELPNVFIDYMPYGLLNLLISHKFDVFGLIDKGLAVAVTKKFNPYI